MAKVVKIATLVLVAGSLGMAAQAKFGERIAAGNPHWRAIMPGVKFAPVYGDWEKGAHGKFVSIDHGALVPMHVQSNDYHAVLTSGRMVNAFENGRRAELEPGDYFHMPAKRPHAHECLSGEDCVFYTHSDGKWDAAEVGGPLHGASRADDNLGSEKNIIDGNKVPDAVEVGEAGRDHIIIRTQPAKDD
jgi:quercetin dioxygenase-like cupin family protein